MTHQHFLLPPNPGSLEPGLTFRMLFLVKPQRDVYFYTRNTRKKFIIKQYVFSNVIHSGKTTTELAHDPLKVDQLFRSVLLHCFIYKTIRFDNLHTLDGEDMYMSARAGGQSSAGGFITVHLYLPTGASKKHVGVPYSIMGNLYVVPSYIIFNVCFSIT